MNHRNQINHNQVKQAMETHRQSSARRRASKPPTPPTRWYRPRPQDRISQCACGAVYTLAAWQALESPGRSQMPPEEGEPPLFEFRNCGCGSTLGMFLDSDGYPVVERIGNVQTMVELGKIAERAGHVKIPKSKYGDDPVAARALMMHRGTELEVLFTLGIEEIVTGEGGDEDGN